MYKIVYTKQAVKDIKNLKSVHLDEKAKILIDIIRENPLRLLWEIYRELIRDGLIFSID
mgnify:CR=1 FL=1